MATRWNAKYPWTRWFALGHFTLKPGRDYDCAMPIMRQQVWNAAARHVPGQRVSVTVGEGDVLEVTVRERSRGRVRRYGGPPKKVA